MGIMVSWYHRRKYVHVPFIPLVAYKEYICSHLDPTDSLSLSDKPEQVNVEMGN